MSLAVGASLEGCACGLGRIYFDRCCGSAAVAPACRGVSPVLNTAVRRWWRTVHHFRGHLCYYLPPANGNAGNPPALQHTPTPRVPGASCFFQPAELGAALRGGMKNPAARKTLLFQSLMTLIKIHKERRTLTHVSKSRPASSSSAPGGGSAAAAAARFSAA